MTYLLYVGLLRLLHCIHSLRLAEPTKRTLMSKIDIKSAYRRGTMSADLAAKSMTIICGMAILLCYLPFGGSNCPVL